MIAVAPSPGVRVTVAESSNRDLSNVSEQFDLWGMILNESQTNIVVVSRSRTMHVQSPLITICALTVLESDDLYKLGMTFDPK